MILILILTDETIPSPPTESEDCDSSPVFEADPEYSSDTDEADSGEQDKGEPIVPLWYVVKWYGN